MANPVEQLREFADHHAYSPGYHPDLYRKAADEIDRLQTIIDAQAGIIDWYETNYERSCQGHVPEELQKLEREWEKAVLKGKN